MNYIDLFAGAGGLSEGFRQNGFNPIAHVELDTSACLTLKTREAYYYLKENNKLEIYYSYIQGLITREEFYSFIPQSVFTSIINLPIGDEYNPQIFDIIDQQLMHIQGEVDIIIGGPPCQAYSLVGRAADKNKMKNDDRNYLYQYYALYLERYRPKIFVFENVTGLFSAGEGQHFRDMKKRFLEAGYTIGYKILKAEDFGVLQQRRRVILIGWRNELELTYPEFDRFELRATINDLFEDLPRLSAGDSPGVCKYTREPNPYLVASGIRDTVDFVSLEITRQHNKRDLKIYDLASRLFYQEGERLDYSKLPEELKTHKNQRCFLDRYKVVNGYGLSHTLVAHIAKDGHYYIHPDPNQNRSISVREAARIQSFPDNYFFEGGRTAAFKQIGNAVPPLMAKGIAHQIYGLLNNIH